MLIAVVRAVRLIIHLMVGLVIALAIHADRQIAALRRKPEWIKPEDFAHWWASVMLDVFNIQYRVRGEPMQGARVTVANHVSWLDIPLIAACEGTRFVSKSEVRDWPVAGMLAEAGGTFYIRRGKGGARPLLDKLKPHLQAQGSIVIFPEGTTTDGNQVKEFHPRLLAAALEAGCPVQPIALRYLPGPDGRNVAPFIGDDDLVSHIWRLLRQPELEAEIIYCAPIMPRGERDALALAAHKAVCTALALPQAAAVSSTAPALAA